MHLRFALFVPPLLAALAFASCSNEGQGQPCDPLAGNAGDDDCQSGLVCTPTQAGSRCCPQNRQTATASECVLTSTVSDASNPAPPDASSSETSTSDGETPVEAAVEAGGDTGPTGDASDGATAEAAADAPSE
jgi:hypothetical protein